MNQFRVTIRVRVRVERWRRSGPCFVEPGVKASTSKEVSGPEYLQTRGFVLHMI